MPPRPAEGQAQRELLLSLRYHIDTAIAYPTAENVLNAIYFATEHPKALRSSHFAHLLGVRRWDWLNAHDVYPVDEAVEIAGGIGIKATITPEVIK